MFTRSLPLALAAAVTLAACARDNPTYQPGLQDRGGPPADGPGTADLAAAGDAPSPWDGPAPADLPAPDGKGLLPMGAPCAAGSLCASGLCVDGVCCATPCQGKCAACNLAGKKGTCAPVPAGKDPRDDCKKADPPNTCKLDGTCDGKGGCRFHPAGTLCKTASCASKDSFNQARVCDGAGVCLPPKTVSCFPYNCDLAAKKCYSACTGANETAVCHGYYGCNTATSACYATCTKDAHCNSKGECKKGKCKKD